MPAASERSGRQAAIGALIGRREVVPQKAGAAAREWLCGAINLTWGIPDKTID